MSNITRKLIGKTDEEIVDRAIDEMRSYHDDGDYATDIDISASIDMAKSLMITNQSTVNRLESK